MTTTTTPAVKRKPPQDRKPTQAELDRDAQLAEDRILASVPPMKDPARLPFRSRNQIIKLSSRMKHMTGADGTLEINEDDTERTDEFLDLLADFADIARTLADQPAQWDEWEATATYQAIGTLLGKYGRAVGESTGSSS